MNGCGEDDGGGGRRGGVWLGQTASLGGVGGTHFLCDCSINFRVHDCIQLNYWN